jgi:hypothetical protein
MAEALMDELVEEILLCLPPSDPASLVRAATVCRQWCRIVSAPGFHRGFAERHRAAPMLGFFANLRDADEDDFVTRFVLATPFCPRHADRRGPRALDARHSRVLLSTTPCGPNLDICDHVTDELRELPRPALPYSPFSWNAAVVCAAHGECDHLDCRRGPFLVVLLDNSGPEEMHVYVYSSEVGTWSGLTYGSRCRWPSFRDTRIFPYPYP